MACESKDGVYTVRIEPGGETFEVADALTVLEAAELAGVRWPSSCRAGTCRTCIGRVLQGEVRYTIEWPGLIPEERERGDVLPCVARAASDLVLCRQA